MVVPSDTLPAVRFGADASMRCLAVLIAAETEGSFSSSSIRIAMSFISGPFYNVRRKVMRSIRIALSIVLLGVAGCALWAHRLSSTISVVYLLRGCARFERDFADFVNRKYFVPCLSGVCPGFVRISDSDFA